MPFIKFFLVFIAVTAVLSSKELEAVSDGDLIHLIKNEDNVVVLFTKSNCNGCEEYEIALENLKDDLKENLGALVVRAHNSPMVGIYDPTKEPSLLYFRRGIPLLYHGKVNEDEILSTFSDNKEPSVRELSDENFEHLTQASTGATTGDWFIFFYSSDCVPCQRLYAIWEAVGAALKRRINVARVRLESKATAKRFDVQKSPEFLFIRQGKFYRYKSTDYRPNSFIQFVESGYNRDKAEPVPPVSVPFDDVIPIVMEFITSRPYFLLFGLGGLVFTTLAVFAIKFLSSKKQKNTKKGKKSK